MKISSVVECHNCHEALIGNLDTKSQTIKCPACGAMNGPGAHMDFVDPEYVSEQMRKINDNKRWMKFTQKRPVSKIKSCGEEYLETLKIILYKTTMTGDDLRELVAIGVAIGELASGIDGYITTGGMFDGINENEKKRRRTRLEIDEANQKNAGSRSPAAPRKERPTDNRLSDVGGVPLSPRVETGDGGVSFTDGG